MFPLFLEWSRPLAATQRHHNPARDHDAPSKTARRHHPGEVSDRSHHLILAVAHHYARRRGLSDDDASDCAAEFWRSCFEASSERRRKPMSHYITVEGSATARLHREADNHAYNMARRLRQHASYFEASLSGDAEGMDRLQRLEDAAPTPMELVIRRELMARVSIELGTLAEEAKQMPAFFCRKAVRRSHFAVG